MLSTNVKHLVKINVLDMYHAIKTNILLIKYIIIFAYISFNTISLDAHGINSKISIKLLNKTNFKSLYINRETDFYYYDSIGVDIDSLCLSLTEPIPVSLFINNDAENAFQFYLDTGNYELNIDCNNKTVSVVGSLINNDYKEMMRVQDSMYKKYNIIHAILYPYNGMDRDSAQEWIRKYLPLCDSLSDIHVDNFYQTHLNSFLTLEYVFLILQYSFCNPDYDTEKYNLKILKSLFDKLGSNLKEYKMYDECVEMFKKEHIKPPSLKSIYNNK